MKFLLAVENELRRAVCGVARQRDMSREHMDIITSVNR